MNNLMHKVYVKNSASILFNLNNRLSTTTICGSVTRIDIPRRIDRDPKSILQALANTVKRDPSSAHYKYHDDPFLIPTSNIAKRTYAMAQEAGRKAAKWVVKENSNLFQHQEADPIIGSFVPKVIYTEASEVDINSLKDVLDRTQVSEAILVYNLLKEKNVEVPLALKLKLLETMCYYNQEDILNSEFIEERWFKQSSTGKERLRKTWKDGCLAEQLFHEMEPKDERMYSAMIRGMSKHFQVEKAWALFQEALDKGFNLDVATYNAIIQVVSFIKESSELRWELLVEILALLEKKQLKPNLETLNSTLQTISSIGTHRIAKSSTLKILSEFKLLGIVPSLATWYYVLIIFCRERGPVSHVLVDIMNEIDGKVFEIQDIKDTFFFATAMDICRNSLHDKELANRINDLLHTGTNYNLIGDSYKESIYYRNYLTLLLQIETLDVFFNNTYNVLVPNVYNPEPSVMDEILKQIDVNGALEFIHQIWSDMVIFEHTNRENLLNRIVKIMVDNPPNVEIESQKNLTEVFSKISWDIWNLIETQPESRSQKLAWTCEMLGSVLELLARNGDLQKAQIVFDKIDKNQHIIVGHINPKHMETYINLCIEERQPSKAIASLQYCVENAFGNSEALANKINCAMTLSEQHVTKLKGLFVRDILK